MQDFPPALQARWLLQQELQGVLSTLSQKHPGFPYGSVVPFCLDTTAAPILLISDLAQHTHNLRAHPQVSLTVTQASSAEKRQASARLCLLAEAQFLVPQEAALLSTRYARYLPEAPDPRFFADFHFVRLDPRRMHLVAGFGKIHWLEGHELLLPQSFAAEQEAAFVEDLNTDEADFLAACWVRLTGKAAQSPVALVGVDPEGGDLRAAQQRQRFLFPHPIQDLKQAWEHLKRAEIQTVPQT